MGCTYLIANSLVKADTSEQAENYWKEKIVFPKQPKSDYTNFTKDEMQKITRLFLRSGISETGFEKIVIAQHTGDAHTMVFSGDGKFRRFQQYYPDGEPSKILTISILTDRKDSSKSSRKEDRLQALDADLFARNGMTYCRLVRSDFKVMNRWKKLPVEVKKLLALDPDKKTIYNSFR